jgi:excisionase family DNA binding protein
MSKTISKVVYTAKELAEIFKTSDEYWRKAAVSEGLKHLRLGRSYRFYMHDVEVWLKQRAS